MNNRGKNALIKGAFAWALTVFMASAQAGENGFGWIYTLDLQPKGKWEFEQKAWLQHGQVQGQYDDWQLKSELEYGVSPDYQLGVSVNNRDINAYRNGIAGSTGGPGVDLPSDFDPTSRYRQRHFESVSVENIWRLANPYTDPVGFGIYLEPALGPNVRELEARMIFQKNFLDDRFIVASNIMAKTEREERSGEVGRASVLDTSLGFTYRFANNMSAGLEYRNQQKFQGYRFNQREHSAHFLGPNFHYARKSWWLTLAWRHQLPIVKAFDGEQQEVVTGGRIYGDEHVRNEFMFKLGFPF